MRIHDNPITDRYTQDEMHEAAMALCRARGACVQAERILVDGARHGYLDQDGKVVHGFSMVPDEDYPNHGGVHVYEQATEYQQVPNREHLATWLLSAPRDILEPALLHLLLKYRTDWYMSWLGRQDWEPEFRRWLAEQGDDAYLTERGEPTCEVRSKPPSVKSEVV